MTSNLPAKLKSADISRFALRAAQLEKAKPAISYWCEYWIVNQLLARGLHSADAECLQYTTTLMDKLEQTKAANANDETIIDDTAGQAYVQQFGLETFERADRAVQADKVTKQTADTFLASSTFLELLNIWGEPGPEILAKIRYAKWNAVRIVKAIKEGKDPNESNPKPDPEPEEELLPLDPNDPEVRALSGAPMQPSVEEVPDEQDKIESRLAGQSIIDRSLHPSAQPSNQPSAQPSPGFDPYPRSGFPYNIATTGDPDVSPIEQSPHERDGSVGGGYFPEVPSGTKSPDLVSRSADDTMPSPVDSPTDFESFLPPKVDDANELPSTPQDFYKPSAPVQPPQPPRPQVPQASIYKSVAVPNPAVIPIPITVPVQTAVGKPVYNTDDEAIAKAQKHARWAISALNFEDAETAVKELRAALQTLGAQ